MVVSGGKEKLNTCHWSCIGAQFSLPIIIFRMFTRILLGLQSRQRYHPPPPQPHPPPPPLPPDPPPPHHWPPPTPTLAPPPTPIPVWSPETHVPAYICSPQIEMIHQTNDVHRFKKFYCKMSKFDIMSILVLPKLSSLSGRRYGMCVWQKFEM